MTTNPAAPPARTIGGPHCPHDDCALSVCDQTGYAEFPCRIEGCTVCGAPSPGTPEHWAADPAQFMEMTPAEQARAMAYWDAYPAMHRATDIEQVIPTRRLDAAHRNRAL
ncbi:hypothetical protein [Actinomadura geliboluensis]|uniref:hypothetical protein n=1 Tax=Actinomadura geliboluensis TaxID=882440 RepID=UPI00367D266E